MEGRGWDGTPCGRWRSCLNCQVAQNALYTDITKYIRLSFSPVLVHVIFSLLLSEVSVLLYDTVNVGSMITVITLFD